MMALLCIRLRNNLILDTNEKIESDVDTVVVADDAVVDAVVDLVAIIIVAVVVVADVDNVIIIIVDADVAVAVVVVVVVVLWPQSVHSGALSQINQRPNT